MKDCAQGPRQEGKTLNHLSFEASRCGQTGLPSRPCAGRRMRLGRSSCNFGMSSLRRPNPRPALASKIGSNVAGSGVHILQVTALLR